MSGLRQVVLCALAVVMSVAIFPEKVDAQAPIGSGTYAAKMYHVNYGYYPIVEAYIRTWGEDGEPLQNVNIANIGLQVKGRNYNPRTAIPGDQYSIETIERRREGFRTVFVLDASGTMKGQPFADAKNGINRFIEAKRPSDQVALIAIRDTDTGYDLLSNFETNPTLLYQRLADVQADGQQTHLYDAIAAALRMCGTAVEGSRDGFDHTVLSSIVVLTDGKDEGSSIGRSELINRIGQLPIPIPIHGLAFSRIDRDNLRNLEAISQASFGGYWNLQETSELTRTLEQVHHINRSDYVVTFRSYEEVDGESHTFRVGIEYPSGSGTYIWSSGAFDAIESPAVFNETLNERFEEMMQRYPHNPAAAYGDEASARGTSAMPVDESERSQLQSEYGSDGAADVSEREQEADEVTRDIDETPTQAEVQEEEDSEDNVMAFIQGQGPLIGMGALLVILLVVVVAWVRSSSRMQSSSASRRDTKAGSEQAEKQTSHV